MDENEADQSIESRMDSLEKAIKGISEMLIALVEMMHARFPIGQGSSHALPGHLIPISDEQPVIPVETFLAVGDDEAFVAQSIRIQKRFRRFLVATGLTYPEILERYQRSETHAKYPQVWPSVSLLSRIKRVSAYKNPTTGNWYHITSPPIMIAIAGFLREQGY